ncbi:MAG: hypothetical protein J0M12_15380 [Deltaproteobacteria bacterium]|nr:hypothetical protein [Deltaproteobacteria bacterium]
MLTRKAMKEQGASMVELCLLLSLIALVALPSIHYLGRSANDRLNCFVFESNDNPIDLSALMMAEDSSLPPLPGSCSGLPGIGSLGEGEGSDSDGEAQA